MALNTEKLNFFAKFIEEHMGIVFSEGNLYQLESRLEVVAKSLNLPDSDKLWESCQNGINSLTKQILLDAATNNETSFFRDIKVFNGIEKLCIPEMQIAKPSGPLRFWSAACSTGQEPYSLSMLLKTMERTRPNLKAEIYATDFSKRVLEKARAGIFSQLEVQRGLSEDLLLKYFSKNVGDQWSINSDIQNAVKFECLNLLEPWPEVLGPFDMILCRNVLIYLSVERKKSIIDKLTSRLQSKGFLVLGGAESMIGLSNDFGQVNFEGAVFYQKKF